MHTLNQINNFVSANQILFYFIGGIIACISAGFIMWSLYKFTLRFKFFALIALTGLSVLALGSILFGDKFSIIRFSIVAVLIGIGSHVAMLLFLNTMLNPIKKLLKDLDSLSRGDFSIDIDIINTQDEIGEISEKLNIMVSEISILINAIKNNTLDNIEMAENLSHRGIKVAIVEMLDQVMAPLDYEMASIVHEHLIDKGVSLYLGDGVKSFSKSNDKIIVATGKGAEIECDMVMLSIGIRPENSLAVKAGLEIGKRGGIVVDSAMRTSNPDIYAVGDAVEIKDFISDLPTMTALAGPANKQGRIAADNAMGRNTAFRGTIGTAVASVFDLTVASTGNNEKTLKQNNTPYIASYTHSGSHAGYYPDSQMMAVKLIFSPGSGRVLGAQIVGEKGVDKRIDVIATAIHGSMTVYDLEELELAYAPPYSSAKDPVNIAGFAAANILKGDAEATYWDNLDDINPENDILIDLRDKEEQDESGYIKGALHIPVNELRERLKELDKSKNFILYCAIGLRGYLGYRIMAQNGFKAKNLSGGYKTYRVTSL